MNFFGKLFKSTILFLILAELFSLLTYLLPPLNQAAFFIIIAIVLALTLIKLKYGLYILLAELFVGGHGHLFSLDTGGFTLSIRMGLFLVILAVWLIKKTRRTYQLPATSYKLKLNGVLIAYFLLLISVFYGLTTGLLNNQVAKVFFDANAWFYFALLPVFLTVIKKENLESLLQILTGATTYLALKTVGVLFLFSHNFAGLGGWFYQWLRDTGVGEITYIQGTLFRVFFQSQLYCLIGFFIVLVFLIYSFKLKDWKNYLLPAIYLYLTSLAVIISQSRSFWVGGVAAIFGLFIFAWWHLGFRIKKTAVLAAVLAIIITSQIFLVQLISGNFAGNLIINRFANLESESAGISRLNQLQPLLYNIGQQALFGYGFGKELTYQSNDPRILKTHPNGIYTTYAFEWGYLDIALKVGIVGLGVYLTLIGYLFYQGIKQFRNKKSPRLRSGLAEIKNKGDLLPTSYFLPASLLLGLAALCVTNIFSPYLNHPLGIGYIMLVSAILNNNK